MGDKEIMMLPRQIVTSLICSQCQNYLSAGPIMLTSKGSRCGRCSSGSVDEPTLSLLNLIAEDFQFPCVNFYAGCNETIYFNKALEHEKVCKQEEFRCPFCKFAGNGCQIVHHFNTEHKGIVLDGGVFTLNYNSCNRFILLEEQNILCFSVRMKESVMEIYNLLITPKQSKSDSFRLKFFVNNDNKNQWEISTPLIKISSDPFLFSTNQLRYKFPDVVSTDNFQQLEHCATFDLNILKNIFKPTSASHNCRIELNLITSSKENCIEGINFNSSKELTSSQKFHLRYDAERMLKMESSFLKHFIQMNSIYFQVCNNCEHFVPSSEVYFCPCFHLSCKQCLSQKCNVCKTFVRWSNTTKLHSIKLDCEDCGLKCDIFSFMGHKQKCGYRKYDCPDTNCPFVGYLKQLKRHWHLGTKLEGSSILLEIKQRFQQFYWILSPDIVLVEAEFDVYNLRVEITIREYESTLSANHNFSFSFCAHDNTWDTFPFSKINVLSLGFVGGRPTEEICSEFKVSSLGFGGGRQYTLKLDDTYCQSIRVDFKIMTKFE